MEIKLIREYFEQGTNGQLFIRGKKIGNTIELPWKNNERRVSCIPEGRYKIIKRYTTRFGWHLLIEEVPGRYGILIHAFNNALKESKGCIAPVSTITGEGKGNASRMALTRLLAILNPVFEKVESIYLTIKKQDHGINN
jgi:hypothetical protein